MEAVALKIGGIIAEYNPFHQGHKYQLEKARQLGFTHIAAVMSGNIVQRGDIAILDAHTRARAAVQNGADLVIELPPPYSASSAADFAEAGVRILSGLGCVDSLVFGSECGDINRLIGCSNALKTASGDEIPKLMSEGLTYPQAICTAFPEYKDIFEGANNTLAVEYINALEGTGIKPVTVKRTVGHDSTVASGRYASASSIRKLMLCGENVSDFVPFEFSSGDISEACAVDGIVLFNIASMSREQILLSPYMSDGVGERIASLVKTASTVSELCASVKTKNVTLSRVRRAVLLAALGVKASDLKKPVPYARVLAANQRGFEILKECKKSGNISVSQSLARLSQQSEHSKRCAELTELASLLRHFARVGKDCGYVSEYERQIEKVFI